MLDIEFYDSQLFLYSVTQRFTHRLRSIVGKLSYRKWNQEGIETLKEKKKQKGRENLGEEGEVWESRVEGRVKG